MKITKNTNMNELLMKKPELAGMLLQSGMGCMGCPMAHMETIEEGCIAHGMNPKEIDKLIERLNEEAWGKQVKNEKKVKRK